MSKSLSLCRSAGYPRPLSAPFPVLLVFVRGLSDIQCLRYKKKKTQEKTSQDPGRSACLSPQDERHVTVFLHQPGGEAPPGLEAGRRGGKVGREGCGRARQEAEEEEGRHGGAGTRAQLPRPAQQLRDHPTLAGRTTAGVTS